MDESLQVPAENPRHLVKLVVIVAFLFPSFYQLRQYLGSNTYRWIFVRKRVESTRYCCYPVQVSRITNLDWSLSPARKHIQWDTA
jgi:hypothetical protein